jgi:phosphoribosylpyrophosphate synthetase
MGSLLSFSKSEQNSKQNKIQNGTNSNRTKLKTEQFKNKEFYIEQNSYLNKF